MKVAWLMALGWVGSLWAERPNIVLVVCDNLGNGDVQCFHRESKHRTPHLNRMAEEGLRLTSFYSASGVCTPSRASLITGCYPRRLNLHCSDLGKAVLQPVAAKGLHPEEETVAELLGEAGYETALIGKWHLGDQDAFLPTRQGFDRYFGIPYSDDMTEDKRPGVWPPLPLMRNEDVVEAPADRDGLTRRYTEEAIAFIKEPRDSPFFLFLSQAMPGSTRAPYSSASFQGRSDNGPWGDSVEELDWSMGEILEVLRETGLDSDTLVIWTSDNGAPRRNPEQGSNLPYRGWGYSTSEGAMRMPCILWWPGRIPAGSTSDALGSMLDVLPTLVDLTEAPRPGREIDGHSMHPVWFEDPSSPSSPSDDSGFFYYHMDQLQAVRSGPWKLYLELDAKRVNLGDGRAPAPLELYDVRQDVGEQLECSAEHPEVVRRLQAMAERARTVLGDEENPGSGQRDAGWVDNPKGREEGG